MKTIRRILALLLALSVVLALGVGVFADGEETTYTITVTSGSNNISIKGCVYSAYRLFDATYSTTGEGDDAKTNVAYKVNEKLKDYEYSVTTGEGESATTTEYKGDALIAYLAGLGDNTDALDAFAKAALKYITTNTIDAAGTVTAGDTATSATIPVDAPGYYLVTGSAKAGGNQLVTAACALTTAKPTAEITLKADVPTVEKKIVETVPNEEEGGVSGTKEELVDANTASIGDKVNYKITSSVPDMKGYNSYWFVLEDTLSKGLTYNDDIVVTVGGVTLKGHTDAAAAVDDFGYTVAVTNNTEDGTTGIEIVLHNFIQYKNNTNKDIVVTYSATVNQDAVLDPNTGNPNTVKLIYSNDPNVDYSGKDEPKDETDKTHVGETPEDKVNTFVTGIKLTKTDGGSPAKTLTGAKFQITGQSMKVVLINKEIYKESTSGTYYMLKNGTYTETAPTADTMAQYDSDTKYEKVAVVDKQTVATDLNTTGYVDENGVLTFEGLGEGTYTITELIAPDGYNLLKDPITITIKATKTDVTGVTWEVKKGTGESAETLTVAGNTYLYAFDVVNNAGTELPSTGGMGTTLFYVIGGLLVVCAGVILVTRKRMSREG